MRKFLLSTFLLIVINLININTQAQNPVVYGVLFYSPSCPHCHQVIENDLPRFAAEFGDQWQLLLINTSTQAGNDLFRTARAALGIESGGVPTLIIGNYVLVGSGQIPQYAPSIIREGLANGGIDIPDVPGMRELFESQLGVSAQNTVIPPTTLWDRFSSDLAGNTAAVVVLIVLGISILSIGHSILNPSYAHNAIGWYTMMALLLIGFGLMTSVLIQSTRTETTLIAVAIGIILLVTLGIQSEKRQLIDLPAWIVPTLMIAGLLVAGYLSYVEVTATEAVCGAIGDCNTVQQSPYAAIAGIPVGVLGIAGYIVMLILWGATRWLKLPAANVLLALTVIGAAGFSVYLTFLEPFVIGATCAWCLTSAIIVSMLLWLIVPPLLQQQKIAPLVSEG